jgi:hypothetical protein
MTEYKTELLALISTVVAGWLGWRFGGKQTAKVAEKDSLTRGADQIVDTSGKLLDLLKSALEEERLRKEAEEKLKLEEQQHRNHCEAELIKVNKKLVEIETLLSTAQKNCKGGCFSNG